MTVSRLLTRIRPIVAPALLLGSSFAFEAASQSAPALPAATPPPAVHAAPAAAPVPADLPPEKGLKGEIWSVANRDPEVLVRSVRALGSGARGATLSADSAMRTISARDFPENLAAIGSAIRRLDVAEPTRADVELKVHVLLAGGRLGATPPVPEDLKEVIAALRGTLVYRDYALLTTFLERVRDRSRVTAGGVAALPVPEGKEPPMLQIEWDARELRVEPGAPGGASVRLERFSLRAFVHGGPSASVATDLTLRPGEKVVVGTSSLGDRGLVVVVSAGVLK